MKITLEATRQVTFLVVSQIYRLARFGFQLRDFKNRRNRKTYCSVFLQIFREIFSQSSLDFFEKTVKMLLFCYINWAANNSAGDGLKLKRRLKHSNDASYKVWFG